MSKPPALLRLLTLVLAGALLTTACVGESTGGSAGAGGSGGRTPDPTSAEPSGPSDEPLPWGPTAAELAQAQELVGMMYLTGSVLLGSDIKADPVRAAMWLRAAAFNGSANSRFVLAMMYLTGVGVPGDAARAEALVAAASVKSASTATTVAVHR